MCSNCKPFTMRADITLISLKYLHCDIEVLGSNWCNVHDSNILMYRFIVWGSVVKYSTFWRQFAAISEHRRTVLLRWAHHRHMRSIPSTLWVNIGSGSIHSLDLDHTLQDWSASGNVLKRPVLRGMARHRETSLALPEMHGYLSM